jgi:hypothetical protein
VPAFGIFPQAALHTGRRLTGRCRLKVIALGAAGR